MTVNTNKQNQFKCLNCGKSITTFKNFTVHIAKMGSKRSRHTPKFSETWTFSDKTAPHLVIRYLKRTNATFFLETVNQSNLELIWGTSRHTPALLSHFTSRGCSFSKLDRDHRRRQGGQRGHGPQIFRKYGYFALWVAFFQTKLCYSPKI